VGQRLVGTAGALVALKQFVDAVVGAVLGLRCGEGSAEVAVVAPTSKLGRPIAEKIERPVLAAGEADEVRAVPDAAVCARQSMKAVVGIGHAHLPGVAGPKVARGQAPFSRESDNRSAASKDLATRVPLPKTGISQKEPIAFLEMRNRSRRTCSRRSGTT
jgi:hypothetical protein